MTYRKEEAGGPHKCGLSASSFYRKNLGRLCKKYIDTAGMLCYNINCINVEYYKSWAGEAEMRSKGILALALALVLLCTQMLPAFAEDQTDEPDDVTDVSHLQELAPPAEESPLITLAETKTEMISSAAMMAAAETFTLTFYVPEGVAELRYAKDSPNNPTELTITDGTCTITGLTGAKTDRLYIFPKLEEGIAFGSNAAAAVDRDNGKKFSFSDGYIYISYRDLHANMRVELVVENNSLHTLEDAPAYTGVSAVKTRDQWPWQVKDGALVPGNTGANKSLSILLVDVDTDGLFAFEYRTSTEPTADCLLYHVNGELALDSVTSADNYAMRSDFSGRRSWSTAYVPVSAGDSVCLVYYKDISDPADVGEDTVWLRNLRVVSGVQSVSIYADSPDYGLTSPGGTVTVSDNWSGGEVDVQETVSVSAHPAEGYDFLGWTRLVGDRWVMYDAAPDATFFVTGPDTYRALFALPDTYVAQNDGAFYKDVSTALSEAEVGNLVVLLQDAVLSQNAVVKSGVTLLIPFDAEATLFTTKPGAIMSWETPYPYRTLSLAEDVVLRVSGELSLGSRISACGQEADSRNGVPTGAYGALMTAPGSRVQVTDGGSLYAWGYLSGDGTVEALSGAKVYECFQIADFRGGSRSMDAFDAGTVPLIQYYAQNIETPLAMHAGAEETVCGAISITKDGDTQPSAQSASTKLVGQGGLFIPAEGSVLTKRYDAASDRIIFEADGDMTFSYMRLSFSGVYTETQSYILPLCPNYTLHLCSGVTTVTQNMLLLPGAEVTVDAGAALTVAEDTDVYVARRGTASIPIHPVAYTVAQRGTDRTWASTGDAHLHVSGQVEVRGGLYVTEDGEDDSPLVTGADGGLLSFTRVATDRASAKYSPSGSTVVSRPVVSLARTLYASAASGCQFRRYCGDWCRSVPDADGYRLAVSAPGFVTRWVAVADGEEPPAAVDLTATGNVNGDVAQQVDVTDMACLFTYLSTGERQGNLQEDPAYFDAVADVNSDGMVNILDYQALYQSFLLTSQ